MKIAIDCRVLCFRSEGLSIYLKKVLNHWIPDYPEFTFYLISSKQLPDYTSAPNVELILLKNPQKSVCSLWYWNRIQLKRVLKKLDVDVFYSCDGFLPPAVKDIKYFVTVHDMAPYAFSHHLKKTDLWFYNRYQPQMLQEAEHIFTISDFSKREIIEHANVKPEKVTRHYNGVELSATVPDIDALPKSLQAGNYFLFYGALHPRKNIKHMIQAYLKYIESGGQKKFCILGRYAWKFKGLKSMMNHPKLRGKLIHITEYVSDLTLLSILNYATALIYMSRYEGFGLPVLECLQYKTPVLTSKGTVMEEIGKDYVMLADPEDVEDISEKMKAIEHFEFQADAKFAKHLEGFDVSKKLKEMMNIILSKS